MKKDNNKSAIQEVYRLPSLGRLYGENFPGDVTIRSMTTFEEKMRLGNQGFWKTMVNIINAVVTDPEDFDANNLTLFDFYFMMYKMRTVSYGPTYKVMVTCPECGRQNEFKVNLDDLKVKYVDEDYKEPFTIGPLPRSGDVLQCRNLRVKDEIEIEKRSKDLLRDNPNYEGDPSYILTRAHEIVKVNDENKYPIESELYVSKMDAMDSAYFQQAYSKFSGDFGLETMCNGTCKHCQEEIRYSLPFNSEFFRPTFDI